MELVTLVPVFRDYLKLQVTLHLIGPFQKGLFKQCDMPVVCKRSFSCFGPKKGQVSECPKQSCSLVPCLNSLQS